MTFTITHEMMRQHEVGEQMMYGAGNSATERMLRDIEKVEHRHKQMDAISSVERITREVEAIKHQAAGLWGAIKEAQLRAYDQIERFRQQMGVIERLKRQMQIVRHRGHDGATGKGKTAAKKSVKSSSSGSSSGGSSGTGGGDGGDGGGDGDGPQRTRSKQKRRPSTSQNNSPRPPAVPPGVTANTPASHFPPRRSSVGRDIAVNLVILCLFVIALPAQDWIQALVIFCLFVIALVAMGQSELAKYVWSSVPTLLKHLTKPPGDES